MKPSGLQGLGLFQNSQTVDKSLRVIFTIPPLENRHLWTPAPWVTQSYWPPGYGEIAKPNQGSDTWTLHLSPGVASFQTVKDQLPFLALLWTVLVFEVLQREEEIGEETSLFVFICGKLAVLLMMAVPVPEGVKWVRKQVEAGPGLLLGVHTPAPEPEGSFKAPGDAEPGITAGGMGFSPALGLALVK